MESFVGNQISGPVPNPKQRLALECAAKDLFYGGAKGGGKTKYHIFEILRMARICDVAMRKHGRRTVKGKAVMFRKDGTQHHDFINDINELYRAHDPKFTWSEKSSIGKFSSGFEVYCAHLDKPNSHRQWNGREITLLAIDQAEEIPEDQAIYLTAQVRTTEPHLVGHERFRLTGNPGGIYDDWLYKRYIEPCEEGFSPFKVKTQLLDGSNGEYWRVFIPAFLSDNVDSSGKRNLGADYEGALMGLPPHLRAAFLFGDWHAIAGAYFSDVWNPRIHIVEPDANGRYPDVPQWQEIYLAADWGTTSPAPIVAHTADNDGVVSVLAELYQPGVDGAHHAKAVANWIDEHGWKGRIAYGVMDPQAWTDYGKPPSPAEDMIAEGIDWIPADNGANARVPGWAEIRKRLRMGTIRIYRRCHTLIKTLPRCRADKIRPDDLDKKQELHVMDALRYGLMMNPQPAIGETAYRQREFQAFQNKHRNVDANRSSLTGY